MNLTSVKVYLAGADLIISIGVGLIGILILINLIAELIATFFDDE